MGFRNATDAPGYLDDILGSFAETTTLPGMGIVEVTPGTHGEPGTPVWWRSRW